MSVTNKEKKEAKTMTNYYRIQVLVSGAWEHYETCFTLKEAKHSIDILNGGFYQHRIVVKTVIF